MATHAYTPGGGMPTRAGYRSTSQRYGRGSGAPANVFQKMDEGKLATGLGLFSIGLGLAEVAAPRGLARLIGIKDRPMLLRALGFREIASGIGILATRRPSGWLWSRVAGDAMDLSLLGSALTDHRGRGKTIMATAAVAGVTALDVLCSRQLTLSPEAGYTAVRAHKSVTIDRSPEELYRFWRDFGNLPKFMQSLESVESRGGNRTHWKAKGPAGLTFEWDAEITADEPNRRIAWRSVEGSSVENRGEVRFERAPGDRGTVVHVELEYAPPGGAASVQIAKLFGAEPDQRISQELRGFKQIMEVGEIVKSDASIHSGMHAAQPSPRSKR